LDGRERRIPLLRQIPYEMYGLDLATAVNLVISINGSAAPSDARETLAKASFERSLEKQRRDGTPARATL